MSQLTHEASLSGEPAAVLSAQAGTGCKAVTQGGAAVHTRQYQEVPSNEALLPLHWPAPAYTATTVEEGGCVVAENDLMSIPDIARVSTTSIPPIAKRLYKR